MTERRSSSFWHNPQISMGAGFENGESVSRNLLRIPQDSLSIFPRQDQQRNTINFFNLDNTINFEQVSKTSFKFYQKNEQPVEEPKDKQEKPIEEDSEIIIEQEQNNQKKGLRYLSKLVYSAMKKKNLTNQNQIVTFVESYLMQESPSKKSFEKESKNIKRRLYDALNVMTAAGVLDKDVSSLTIKNNTLQIPNKFSLNDKRDRSKKQVSKRQKRLIQKKIHLMNIHKKLQSLKTLIQRNKKLINDKNDQQLKDSKLKFPLIMVNSISKNNISLEYNKQKQCLKICTTGDIEMHADLDLVKLWTESQIILSKSQQVQKIETVEHSVCQDGQLVLQI